MHPLICNLIGRQNDPIEPAWRVSQDKKSHKLARIIIDVKMGGTRVYVKLSRLGINISKFVLQQIP